MMRSNCETNSGPGALRPVLFATALAAATVWAVAGGPATKPASQSSTRPAGTQASSATSRATTRAAASKPAEPPPVPLTADEKKAVEAAIAGLSADSWKERQAAQDALVPFGQQVVARLRAVLNSTDDEEVRTRASAALRQIEENATLGGSVITLHLKNAPAKEAFDALARQARCEFPTYPKNLWQQNNGRFGNPGGGPASATVTVDFERAGFWDVFKEVCKQSGVFPQQYGNDRRMTLGQGQSNYWNGPTFVSGPFMIVANRLDRSNSVDLGNPNNVQRSFAMGMSAFAEPKVKVLSSSYNVQLDSAVDDNGNSLLATDAQGFNGMSNGQQWMWSLSARLNYPDNPGKRIKSIKGNVKFLVQTKSETLDIPEVMKAKNVTKTVANCRLLLKEVKKNGEQYDVQMTIYRDGMSQQEWNSLQYPGYAVRLLDEDGRQFSAQGWGGGGSATELNYNWNFGRNNWGGGDEGKMGEPYRLVWEIPLETRESAVNFEFKDLPLP